MIMSVEIWKPVVGFEGFYEVSNLGRVKSLDRMVCHDSSACITSRRKMKGRILKNGKDGHGYFHVNLCKDGNKTNPAVHRLVAQAFIPKIEGKEYVNHIDSDFTNNNVNNLEWCTQRENLIHGRKYGNIKQYNEKKVMMFSKDMEFIREFKSICEASRITGICETGIRGCCNNKPKYHTAGGYIWQFV